MTITYQATNACNWRNGRYIPHTTQDIRQGVWEDFGISVGVMVFSLTAIRSQFATHFPVRATLALTRTTSGAHGSALPLRLYAGNQTGIPAATQNVGVDAPRPTRVSSLFTATISAGMNAKSVGISTALIESIGNGGSNCLFIDAGASTAEYMSFSGRNNLASIRLTVEWSPRTTATGAPTSASVNQTIAENNVTLSWAGASGGINNGIIGYDIQFSDSANNSAWGAWTDLTTVTMGTASGSFSVSPPPTRGDFRRFRVRTRGAAGADFFSGWRISSNSVRRNTWANRPASVVAVPEVYSDETVTLTWAGASPGLVPIRGFQIGRRISTDNQTWSAWTVLAIIDLAATGGTFTPTVSRVPGTYTQFGVWTIDILGSFSNERLSNSILNVPRDRPPLVPLVTAPQNGSVTYNAKPMIFIQVQPEPDGQPQTVYVRVGDGVWHNSIDNPEYFSTSGELPDNARTVYTADELPPGSHTVTIRTSDGGYDSPAVTRAFTVLASPFDVITANVTDVKARHITDLRAAANSVRNYYGMAAYAWNMEISAGKTQVIYFPFHIMELRAAMQAAVDFIRDFDGVIPPIDWIAIGTGRPRATVMNQLMDLILMV